MIYSKRESEIILVKADFSDRLEPEEDISYCTIVGYQYDDSAYQLEDFDLADTGYVIVELRAGTETLQRKSYPSSGYATARLALLPTVYEEADILTADSLDGEGRAQEVQEKAVMARVEGGTAGLIYRVVFTAITNFDNKLIEEQIVNITTD